MSSVRRVIGTAAILAGFSLFGPVSVAFALELPAVADQNCEGFEVDGIACETRPAQLPDKDCAGFPTRDGHSCGSRFGGPVRPGQVEVKPVGGVATGGGEPDEPNGGLLEIGAVALTGTALLIGSATGASLLLRRRAER
ncbi:excalibur calcium-binding protein [Amycolatopsis sp. NPDC089917]|uniref:excalibur calcium-binding protein n=1 Tax=Amycolatopsis sp. NPDC089917 TaxID=3155187 RepID=UPI00341FBD86